MASERLTHRSTGDRVPHPHATVVATVTSPCRLLILDRDPANPKWVLAQVALPADVRPAALIDMGAELAEVTRWIRSQTGRPAATLVPVDGALAWRVDERPQGHR